MRLEFDFDNVVLTEFGIGKDDNNVQTFSRVNVDGEIKEALREMAQKTWESMKNINESPERYNPAEKHSSNEHLFLPLDDPRAELMEQVHTATNLPFDGNALADPSKVFCYFVRMKDRENRRLTALRRSTHFKGILKNRLVRFVTNALKMVEDKVFKLDSDFDLLISDENLHILRPSGFEFVCNLKEAILKAVPDNIGAIQQEINFVDFSPIEKFALKHPRAARYLASIRTNNEMVNISKGKLLGLCTKTDVEIVENEGTIEIGKKHIMGFLEVLDRRRYPIDLIEGEGETEAFRASSRSKLR